MKVDKTNADEKQKNSTEEKPLVGFYDKLDGVKTMDVMSLKALQGLKLERELERMRNNSDSQLII